MCPRRLSVVHNTASAGCNSPELLTLALVCARGTTASCLDLGGCGLFEKISYLYFPVGLAVWEGVQSADEIHGIQIDRFSAGNEPSWSMLDDFHNIDVLFV